MSIGELGKQTKHELLPRHSRQSNDSSDVNDVFPQPKEQGGGRMTRKRQEFVFLSILFFSFSSLYLHCTDFAEHFCAASEVYDAAHKNTLVCCASGSPHSLTDSSICTDACVSIRSVMRQQRAADA